MGRLKFSLFFFILILFLFIGCDDPEKRQQLKNIALVEVSVRPNIKVMAYAWKNRTIEENGKKKTRREKNPL